jgi:uncharacterized membrane protein
MIHSSIGMLHLLSAGVSLIVGSWVLFSRKGTQLHKKIGYAYALAMVVVNVTAFCIYRLFSGFGPFHVAAIISLLTLVAGMVPAILRKPKNWFDLHFAFMYYSVIGLYAAFVSETLVRIPGTHFGSMVGFATCLVMFIGIGFFQWKRKQWLQRHKPPLSSTESSPISH